jgi:hypothetical protein
MKSKVNVNQKNQTNKKNMKGGVSPYEDSINPIPVYSQTSPGWNSIKGEEAGYQPFAVDMDVGYNEYIFGRTTPNNDFVVTTGLVKDPMGFQMTGAGKSNKINDLLKLSSIIQKDNKMSDKQKLKKINDLHTHIFQEFSLNKLKKNEMVKISQVITKLNSNK